MLRWRHAFPSAAPSCVNRPVRLLKKLVTGLFGREPKRSAVGAVPSLASGPVVEAEGQAQRLREAAEHLAAGRPADAEHVLALALQRQHDDVEALLLQGLAQKQRGSLEDAADSFLLAAHFRPEFGEAHYQLGLVAALQGRSTEAEQHYRRALRADPRHVGAHVALGALLIGRDLLDEAVECFRRAIAIDPNSARAHSNLGALLAGRLDRFNDAAPHLEKAWRLAPHDPDVMCNWAMYLQSRGQLAEAIALCDRLTEADPAAQIPRLNRALARLKMGDFLRGWPDYESRKQVGWPYLPRTFAVPEWQGEPLAGRRILVHAEQGLGDQIMFASCIPDLLAMAGHCVIECAPKLEALFRRSFAGATVVSSAGAKSQDLCQGIDCYVAVGSLPLHLRTSRDSFPAHRGYLRADPGAVSAWRRRLESLPGSRKVGIAWRGGASSTRRSVRSVALDQWLPILQRGDASFVSLQHTDCREEIEAIGRNHRIRIHHWQEAIDDYDQTAALVCALDLVLSVQTAIVHLGGALGKRVWVMVPAVAEWRYLQSEERLPWYPAVRIFRQARPEDWGPVIERMAFELGHFAVAGNATPAAES